VKYGIILLALGLLVACNDDIPADLAQCNAKLEVANKLLADADGVIDSCRLALANSSEVSRDCSEALDTCRKKRCDDDDD
jgi:hypothetical protein